MVAAQSLVGAALGSGDATAGRAVAWQVARYGLWAGVAFAAAYAAGYAVIPRLFSSSDEVVVQARVLWPWFVAILPAAGVVFALDGVLIGAGDVRFMAALTLVAGIGVFVPLTLAALYGGWGLGGVWAGLAAFVGVRLVGMVLRTRGSRWVVLGAQR